MKQKYASAETFLGVTLISRHGIEPEIVRMRKSVASLPDALREEIIEYFADSKAGSHYVIEVRNAEAVASIARYLPPLRGSVIFTRGGERVGEVRVM